MKRHLSASALLGVALFFAGCATNEGQGGPKQPPPATSATFTPPAGSPAARSSGSPMAGSPVALSSGAPSAAPAASGAPSAAPASGVPQPAASGAPGPAASGAPGPAASGVPGPPPGKPDTKIEPKPKTFPSAGEPDPANILRVFVLDDGSFKPGTFSATAGKPITLLINNYSSSPVTIEVGDKKATAGASEKAALPVKLEAGEHKITIGAKSATLTVK